MITQCCVPPAGHAFKGEAVGGSKTITKSKNNGVTELYFKVKIILKT
jgi:hypothetical protein